MIIAQMAVLASCYCVWFLAGRLANFIEYFLAGLIAFGARAGYLAESVSASFVVVLASLCLAQTRH